MQNIRTLTYLEFHLLSEEQSMSFSFGRVNEQRRI